MKYVVQPKDKSYSLGYSESFATKEQAEEWINTEYPDRTDELEIVEES